MNYREAHRILDRSYLGLRRARVWMCWLLAAVAIVVGVVGVMRKEPAAAIGTPIVCLLLAFLWWSLCSAYMVIVAGIHALISTARAQVDDVVDADSDCAALHAKRMAKVRQQAQPAAPPAQAAMPPVQTARTQPERPLGQLPGESLDAWAKRMEAAELAAFKARSKA